jgi:hypothetical protein
LLSAAGTRRFNFRLLNAAETTTKIPRFSFRFLNRGKDDSSLPLESAALESVVAGEGRRNPPKRELEAAAGGASGEHVGQEYSHHYRHAQISALFYFRQKNFQISTIGTV